MLFYITILLLICFSAVFLNLAFCYKGKEHFFLYIWGGIFFLLYVCKHNLVGTDYIGYLQYFGEIKPGDWSFLFSSERPYPNFEKGYLVLTQLMSLMSQTDTFFTFIMAIIMSISPLVTIKRYAQPVWAGVFVFFALGIYINSFNILRQTIAMYICWLSIPYILNRSFIKFFFLVTLAFFFHKTSLIFIPLYFVPNIKFSFRYCFTIVLIACSIYVLLLPIMSYLTIALNLNNYLESDVSGGYMLLLFMLCCFIICICALKNKLDSSVNFFIHMLFWAALLQIMAIKFNILTRFIDYYKISLIVLLPRAIYSPFFRKNRRLIIFSFIILFICYFYKANISNLTGAIPYMLR